TPGLRVYSAVDISGFKELLRTETWDNEGHSAASTLNGALPRGQWNFVVITVDRRHDAQRVYVNGRDVTRTDHLGHRQFVSKGPVLLGAYTTDNEKDRWRDLDGALDDVRIYRGHLRAKEIEKISNPSPIR
ncbi:MAG TPA: LamG-like jellyroll fold domain-containing protein, partial [Clostridia bacterium]|nr:LamG-like jellyroll fold domain-containing protein [Clostridia bacterium]